MPTPSSPLRPGKILVPLFYGATGAHSAFVLAMIWLTPGIDFGAITALMFLPFFYFTLAFIPVTLLLVLVRLAVRRLAPQLESNALPFTGLLAVIGLGVAAGLAAAIFDWLPHSGALYRSVLLGAAVGGIVTGYKVAAADVRSKSLLERLL